MRCAQLESLGNKLVDKENAKWWKVGSPEKKAPGCPFAAKSAKDAKRERDAPGNAR